MSAAPEVVTDTDLDFVVVDYEQDCRDLMAYGANCGIKHLVPASWAAPELRAQQAALRAEAKSVFAFSASEKKALSARPVEMTLFADTPAPVKEACESAPKFQKRKAAYASAKRQAPKVRAIAPAIGLVESTCGHSSFHYGCDDCKRVNAEETL